MSPRRHYRSSDDDIDKVFQWGCIFRGLPIAIVAVVFLLVACSTFLKYISMSSSDATRASTGVTCLIMAGIGIPAAIISYLMFTNINACKGMMIFMNGKNQGAELGAAALLSTKAR